MDDDPEFLADSYRRYFELRRLGMSAEDIAAELGIPEEAWEAFVALAEAKASRSEDPLR